MNAEFDWLAALLELLFDTYETADARELLTDASAREAALRALTPALLAAGATSELLASSQGDNLLMASLALRVKFPRAEARAKVQMNIAMRRSRGG